MTGEPTQGGHYLLTEIATGAEEIIWVYVSPKQGACIRRRGSLGSTPINASFLRRHDVRGPIKVPDRMPGEV